MPLYQFDYSYTARGSRTEEFDNDDEARAFGWESPEELVDPYYDYDFEIDEDDVEISEVDEQGETIREVYEEDN